MKVQLFKFKNKNGFYASRYYNTLTGKERLTGFAICFLGYAINVEF